MPRFLLLTGFLTLAYLQPVRAEPQLTTYEGRPAYRLSDGQTEAIVVPQLGRVMSYGFVNGPNLLWKPVAPVANNAGWTNYGGDKTWPAPQSWWPLYTGKDAPPPAWDGEPHTASILPDGALELRSNVSPELGSRIVREFRMDGAGDFLITQRVEKVSGSPVYFSLWSVTQTVTPDAIFLPLKPDSTYASGYHWLYKRTPKPPWTDADRKLLRVTPAPDEAYKLGVDSPYAAIAAVYGSTLFLQSAPRTKGEYPDGAAGAGFPVELFVDRKAPSDYCELELLSPLKLLRSGNTATHTLRWHLEKLVNSDWTNPTIQEQIYAQLSKPKLIESENVKKP